MKHYDEFYINLGEVRVSKATRGACPTLAKIPLRTSVDLNDWDADNAAHEFQTVVNALWAHTARYTELATDRFKAFWKD